MSPIPAEFFPARRYWHQTIGAIFAFALLLRWPWPGPQWQHVDERAFILHPLGFWGGDFNPHFFNYPTLHFYLSSALYYLYYLFCSALSRADFLAYHYFVGGEELIAISRGFNAVLSAATVVVVAFIGRRLYGTGMGALAGLLAAVLPLSVRFAHLAITDVPAVWWLSAAVFFAVRIVQDGQRRDLILAGVCVGLAGGSKYPAAVVAVAVAVACMLRGGKWRDLLLAGGSAVGVFALVSPFVVLDFGRAWEDLAAMGEAHLIVGAAPAGMPAWAYYLGYGLRYGLGLLGLLATAVGLLWKPKDWRAEERVILAAFVACSVVLFVAESTFMRYAMPLAPLAVLIWLRPLAALRWPLALAVVAALMVEPLYASWQTRALLAGDDTRTQAGRWLDDVAPNGAWIIDVPKRVGNVPLLRPSAVFAREQRFRQSYTQEDLLPLYAALSRREDLPPLFPSPGSGAFTRVADKAPRHALVLHYRHPVISAEIGGDIQALLERCEWVREFSPGGEGVYEAVDWFFAPIGRFAGVERTGPDIRVGRIPLGEGGTSLSGRRFFAVLHGIIRGERLVAEGDWHGVVDLYQEIWQSPLPLDHFLSADYLYAYFFNFGVATEKLGQLRQATHMWEQALALKDDRPVLHQNLGVAYARQGRSAMARDHLQRALALDGAYAEAHFNLGNLLYQQDELDGAFAAFARAIDADPKLTGAWQGLGNVHFNRGQWPEALAAYRRALTLDPTLASVAFNMAKVHLQTAAPDSAIAVLHLALAVAPEDVEALYLLGDLYRHQGSMQEARAHYARALELAPEDQRAGAVRQYLERGL